MRVDGSRILLVLAVVSCWHVASVHSIAEELMRTGDEIVVCGRLYHIETPVVTWFDVGGYDAYRTEQRYQPWNISAWPAASALAGVNSTLYQYGPTRYSNVRDKLPADMLERVRGGSGWTLADLQSRVNKFVMHYDVEGYARRTFEVLQDLRDLSIHFMLDLDGTLYQTLDLKDQARHATIANPFSIGIEIANVGAYPPGTVPDPFSTWYSPDPNQPENALLTPPAYVTSTFRNTAYKGRPMRPQKVSGSIQGTTLEMYDLTPEQYATLIRLTAALSILFPNMPLAVPRNADGSLITSALDPVSFAAFHGIVGHYHVQSNKQDPGPAFQFDYVLAEAAKLVAANTKDGGGDDGPSGGAIAAAVIIPLLISGFALYYFCVYRKQQNAAPKRPTRDVEDAYSNFTG